MKKRGWFTRGVVAVLVLIGISYVALIGIKPTDTKIIDLLHEKEENLLGVVGVVGSGIARDENNHIIGIAVYVEGNVTDLQDIPSKLGEFTVYIKEFTEACEFEKERMIIYNKYYNLLDVVTDKTMYQQNDDVTITIKNESNETFNFGNSVYDLSFERWNGSSWEFYTGVIGLEVITYLNPGETGEIAYQLGGQTEKPFPSGTYRALSTGWLDPNGQALRVWGYAELRVG
jgi:hypothetical protein